MRTKMQSNVTELFDQAIETFDSALRTGVRIQEEATKWWTDMINEADSLQELQMRTRVMMNEAMPAAQKSVDQAMKLIDRTYRTSLDLLKKAFETGQSESIYEAQMKTQELWEATLAALRTNAQAIVQVNAQAMESWAEFAHRDIAGMGMEQMEQLGQMGQKMSQKATQRMESMAQKGAELGQKAAGMGQKTTRAGQKAARPRRKAAGQRTARRAR
jgi:hypothetical protein